MTSPDFAREGVRRLSATLSWHSTYDSEAELASAVRDYIRQRGDVLITRVESGGTSRKNRKTETGSADWQGVVQGGRHVELELKKRKGVSSPEQIKRGLIVERLGGVYAVCRSVAEVHAAIERAQRGL